MDSLCLDMTPSVATTVFQRRTEACRDKVFSVATEFGHLVSQHSLDVAIGCDRLVLRHSLWYHFDEYST